MNEYIPEAYAAFSADGTADGYAVVTDNTPFYPGALAWIWSDTIAPRRVKITDLVGTTKIGVRYWGNSTNGDTGGIAPTYGRTPINTFTSADHSKINMEGQVVRVVQPTFSKVSKA